MTLEIVEHGHIWTSYNGSIDIYSEIFRSTKRSVL